MQITPAGGVSVFATISADSLPEVCPGGIGLTTGLVVLKFGWVIVGSLPTTGPNAILSGAGCLIVLNAKGVPVKVISGTTAKINGPWDMTALDQGKVAFLFVANTLNGGVATAGGSVVNEGTIVRIKLGVPQYTASGKSYPSYSPGMIIGSGFSQQTNSAALILGPTGVGFDPKTGFLYVADTINNRIAMIPDALTRDNTATSGGDVTSNINLNQPLGVAIAPNGYILTVNAQNGYIVEISPEGTQVATFQLIKNGGGALFGLAVVPDGSGIYFVNDDANTLMLFH